MLLTSFIPRSLVSLAALSCALFVAPLATAQTSASETAKVTQLFKNGKAAFGKGDMAEAERLFAEAFALRKSSDIAANLGQAELEQQKFRAAAEHFQWALANLLPSASDAQRKAVEVGLAKSRAEVGLLRLEIQPDGAEVLVGEQDLGKAPIAGGVYVDPGEVIVSVKHPGYIAIDKRVMASKGTEQAVEVALVPKNDADASAAATQPIDSGLQHGAEPRVPPRADTGSGHKSLVPAYVASGVAVAGGVTGLVLLLSANSKADDADERRDELQALGGCGEGGSAPAAPCADLTDRRKSVDTLRNLEVGAFIVGGVAALAAGYFYWDALSHRSSAGDKTSRRGPRPSLAVTPRVDLSRALGRDGAALQSVKLGLSGTF
jgi:tetratricopeptide (TPR) repeat protein